MYHYKRASPRGTPPPNFLSLQRGADPAVQSSNPPPDVVRPQGSILPDTGAAPPAGIPILQRAHHAAPPPSPRSNIPYDQRAFPQASSSRSTPRPPRAPDFLIIGLFALRLAKRLIEGLEPYSHRDADVSWLRDFLMPYPAGYALAKISGHRKDEYVAMYQDIVSRMRKQPRYPMRFMQMNPDPSLRREGREGLVGEMTDRESYAIL